MALIAARQRIGVFDVHAKGVQHALEGLRRCLDIRSNLAGLLKIAREFQALERIEKSREVGPELAQGLALHVVTLRVKIPIIQVEIPGESPQHLDLQPMPSGSVAPCSLAYFAGEAIRLTSRHAMRGERLSAPRHVPCNDRVVVSGKFSTAALWTLSGCRIGTGGLSRNANPRVGETSACSRSKSEARTSFSTSDGTRKRLLPLFGSPSGLSPSAGRKDATPT